MGYAVSRMVGRANPDLLQQASQGREALGRLHAEGRADRRGRFRRGPGRDPAGHRRPATSGATRPGGARSKRRSTSDPGRCSGLGAHAGQETGASEHEMEGHREPTALYRRTPPTTGHGAPHQDQRGAAQGRAAHPEPEEDHAPLLGARGQGLAAGRHRHGQEAGRARSRPRARRSTAGSGRCSTSTSWSRARIRPQPAASSPRRSRRCPSPSW